MLGCRIVGLIRCGRLEREMDDEIQSHLAMQAEENERRGMAAEDARLAARRSFGNVDFVKEQHRDKHRLRIIDQLFLDTRHAMRSLLRRPAHTLTAALCLAVGLTVSIVTFSVLISFFFGDQPGVSERRQIVQFFCVTVPIQNPSVWILFRFQTSARAVPLCSPMPTLSRISCPVRKWRLKRFSAA